MRTFFLQIFLAFWVSIMGIFLVATAFNPDGQHGSMENILAFSEQDAAQVNASAVAVYQHHGCEIASRIGKEYLLTNAQGRTFCGQQLSAKTEALIQKAVQNDRVEGVHDASLWVTATPFHDAKGLYVVLHRGEYVPRPWFPHLPAVALPVSLAVTFLFAFLLTLPVRSLSRAFREFSAGDLSVRLPVAHGKSSGWGGSDVRSLMQDFNHMADRVSGLIDAQKLLVRDVSHELRSPLARLRLALEMAREEATTPLPALDRMEIEAERVNDLIGQMLTLSMMESTRELTSIHPVDLSELLAELMPALEFEAMKRERNATLMVSSEKTVILGNVELLRRMIENVVRNAIRHTAKGTSVEIALRRVSSAGTAPKDKGGTPLQSILIEVSDRGSGVPEESLPKLFRAFYRTDHSRNDATGGYGIGLTIAERAAHLHNGTITARNRAGGGLLITMTLPVQSHLVS